MRSRRDNFYEPGEGLGNIVITATNTASNTVFSTTTWSSGGYTLALPAGTYSVTATGSGLGNKTFGDVTIGSQNVEADFTPSSSNVATGTTGSTPVGTTGSTVPTSPTVGPSATLAAKNLTKPAASYSFTVTYTGQDAIDPSTLNKKDLTVTGPSGYRGSAEVVSSVSSLNGRVRKVTYRLAAPSRKWTSSNNGIYHVYVRANQVADVAGNFVDPAILGYFKIKI